MPPKPYRNGTSRPLSPLEQEARRLVHVAFSDSAPPHFEWPGPGVSASAEISETSTHWSFSVDLPGHDPENIQVEVANEALSIRSERRDEKDARGEWFHRSERFYGSYHRSFTLPDGVDTNRVTAAYRHGVLTVMLPKLAAATSKVIPVKMGEDS